MEENMNTEIIEVEEEMMTEDNDNANAMLVIAGIGVAGALIGIGLLKLGSKVKQKLQEYWDRKVVEVIETMEDAKIIDAECKEAGA
jgi:hypothetical protein